MLLDYIDLIPPNIPARAKLEIHRQISLELNEIEQKMRTLELDIMRESLRIPGRSRF